MPRTRKPGFASDAACWVAYADKKETAPSCACGKPAIGAVFTEYDSGYPMGQITGTAEFDCGCQGQKAHALKDVAGWDLFDKLAPGLYRVRKKTPQERIKEVTSAATQF